MVAARDLGEVRMGSCLRQKVSVSKDEKVLEMDGSIGGTTI